MNNNSHDGDTTQDVQPLISHLIAPISLHLLAVPIGKSGIWDFLCSLSNINFDIRGLPLTAPKGLARDHVCIAQIRAFNKLRRPNTQTENPTRH